MTYLKTITGKLFGAIAAIAIMTSATAAQDSGKPVSKLAQLQLKADALNDARDARLNITPKATPSPRRIVRQAVPMRVKSVQALNQGRIFTSHDYADDAMRVYKTHTSVSARYIPNHFQATAK